MKRIIYFAITLLLSLTAIAALKGAPYMPELDERLDAIEDDIVVLEALPASAAPSSNGIINLRIARFTVDCAVSSDCSVGAHSLDVTLPAKSLITSSYFYVHTGTTSVSGGTIAVSCEDAGNILAAKSLDGAVSGTKFMGAAIPTSGSTILSNIAAECEIVATVASADYTAGKINGWVEYSVHD